MNFRGLNHVNLVVASAARTQEFLVDVLGLEPHAVVPVWFVAGDVAFHVVEVEDAGGDTSVYRQLQHVAFEVDDLNEVYERLTAAPKYLGLEPFRIGLDMQEQPLATLQDIDKGIGTIFVRDSDGNLFEFVQLGRGIYAEGGLEALMRTVQDMQSNTQRIRANLGLS